MITLFAISLFILSLQVTMLWKIRGRIARVAFGFPRTQHKAKLPNHQQPRESWILSGAGTASNTTQGATLVSFPEAHSGDYPGYYTEAYSETRLRHFSGSSSAYRSPYDSGIAYRSPNFNHYNKNIVTARPAAIFHSEYVRGYDTNNSLPSYTSPLHRSYDTRSSLPSYTSSLHRSYNH